LIILLMLHCCFDAYALTFAMMPRWRYAVISRLPACFMPLMPWLPLLRLSDTHAFFPAAYAIIFHHH